MNTDGNLVTGGMTKWTCGVQVDGCVHSQMRDAAQRFLCGLDGVATLSRRLRRLWKRTGVEKAKEEVERVKGIEPS